MTDYWPVAKKFFLTKGDASSDTEKGAMQKALIEAGIQQCNIIEVSSVLDPDAQWVDYDKKSIPHAAIAFSVFAHQGGTNGETIGAGVGVAWMKGREGVRKAYVVEASGYKTEGRIKRDIMLSLVDIADAENLVITPTPYFTKGMKRATEPLLDKRKWEKKAKAEGRAFEGFKDPENSYVKYLKANSDFYFRMATADINGIPDDCGYVAAALVYVFETDQVTTKAHV